MSTAKKSTNTVAAVAQAWKARRPLRRHDHATDGTTYYLFGNAIARWADDGVAEYRTAGYNTQTTQRALQRLGMRSYNVRLKGRRMTKPVLDTQLWENPAEWTRIGKAGPALWPSIPDGWEILRGPMRDKMLTAASAPFAKVKRLGANGFGDYVVTPKWVVAVVTCTDIPSTQRVRALKIAAQDEQARAAFETTLALGYPDLDVLLNAGG